MSQVNKRKEPWKPNERYYCAVCNAWMGSDRQSILIHTNGKKHRENMEANLIKRREEKLRSEKKRNALASSLKKMEEMAAKANNRDAAYGISHKYVVGTGNARVKVNGPQETTSTANTMNERDTSYSRKKNSEKSKLAICEKEVQEIQKSEEEKKIALKEGNYTIGDKTYLEGSIFASIFEEDMTVQIWTGSSSMNVGYKKSSNAQSLWKIGIILKVQKEQGDSVTESALIKCHVSYLKNYNDEDETIEKHVEASRLRLMLGADEFTPKTIEEAHIALRGGEQVTLSNQTADTKIDENTGLSGWGTVSVRKMTGNYESKQERIRLQAKKREEARKEKMKLKETEARRMEEAKHENNDVSALGAYDPWSKAAGKTGYKGVQIIVNPNLDVSLTAKSLSHGRKNVKFKKRSGDDKKGSFSKNVRKKKYRRTTFSEDD